MKRILVALDGSTRAPGVLGTARMIAAAQGAQITLLRSVGMPPDVPQDFWRTTDEPLLDLLEHRARDYLAGVAKDLPAAMLAGCEVVVGTPWQAICDAARRLDSELVVLGSHGYSGVDRLLGTTAAKVVNHAHCSVVVVREPAAAARG